jgi:16S rRNA C967 or C1407 C5-methylase (RsmB/RsmF family)
MYASRLLRNDAQVKHPELLYDKVIVDAECTHDGSISHLWKQQALNWTEFEKAMHPDKLANLQDLQRNLLQNGFRLLKPNGILVYSTCSFSRKQNEDIIAWFLDTNSNASLEQVPESSSFPLAPMQPGYDHYEGMKHVIRFSPSASNTSGLFIARIRKNEPPK